MVARKAKQLAPRRRKATATASAKIAARPRARYAEVFDLAPIGLATVDRDGVVCELNHAGARLLGAERRKLIGKRFAPHVSPAEMRAFDKLLRAALASSACVTDELELRSRGVATPVRLTAGALHGTETTIMLAFEDISDRRRNELELEKKEVTLREVNRRKDEFLAMLSHELRNPLAPISASVTVLQMAAPGSDAAKNAIDIIDRSALHLARIVDDLLDVTRITRGTIALKRERVELTALLRTTVRDQQPSFETRGIHVHVQAADEPIWIYGDQTRIVQVLSNVLGNAAKFTPARGDVTLSLERRERSAIITIKDSGIGISSELLPELFEPFAQGMQPLDRNPGGLGLGLAMAKSLVELHGGCIAVRSDGINRGTEVVISLPTDDGAHRAPVGPSQAPQVVLSRRVVIIEDQRDAAHSMQQALLLRGHEADVAYDGKTGLDLICSFRPDVVLCDLGLPDMDGYEVAMRVRVDPILSRTCMIALSGYARPEDVKRAKAAGFDRHMAKPPDLREVYDLLATLPSQRDG